MRNNLPMLGMEFDNSFESVPKQIKKLQSLTIGGGGGGGSSGQQQVTSTVTQSNLPAYVQPYFEQVLQRGLFESARPYQPYGGQRLAQFAPEETAAQRGIAGLQRPEQLGMASDIAAQVGYGQMPSGMDIASQFQPGAISPDYRATQFQTGYGPGQFGADYQAGAVGPGYQAMGYQPQFQAREFAPGYQAGQVQAGFEAGSMAAPGTLTSYMSPYQQAVTDIEKREAVRASETQRPQVGAGAARAGALGGTRATLLEAERQRNLGQQLGDIQARGSQAGFEQARAGFEADRAARLQQAQFGLGAFQAQEGARQRAAEMGMSAQQQAEASRQAAEQFRQSAFQQTEAGRQAQAQLGLSGFQAQEAARQQQAQFQLQSQQAGEQARQEAARLGLTAQQQTDAARRAEQEFRTQAQQFNIEQQRQRALLGLEGLSSDRAGQAQRLAAAELLSGFGGRQQEMDLQRLAALGGVGSERRGLMQRGLDLGYEDFLRQQAYGREQLGYLSNLLQGVPVTPGSTVSTFGRVPSPEQQALGAGIGALGLYQAFGGRGRQS
jgi:hypothetical protein